MIGREGFGYLDIFEKASGKDVHGDNALVWLGAGNICAIDLRVAVAFAQAAHVHEFIYNGDSRYALECIARIGRRGAAHQFGADAVRDHGCFLLNAEH